MKNIKIFDRRVGFSLGALSILFGTMAPAVLPAFASADSQITSRSITMSNSATSNANTTYTITFTPDVSTGSYGFAVEFCSNSPLVSSACTAPTGMDVSTAAVGAGTITTQGANYLVATETITASTANTITLTGVTNPNIASPGSFYGKIFIYNTAAHAGTGLTGTGSIGTAAPTYPDTNLLDDGSVAMAVTSSVGVQAAVLESLTFCVMGDAGNKDHTTGNDSNDVNTALGAATAHTSTSAPKKNCVTNTNTPLTPAINLGQWNSGVQSLDTSTVSYAYDWTQINTNAGSGAVVYLKSNLSCAGLSRNAGTDTCAGIPSVNAADAGGTCTGTGAFTAGTKAFGFSVGTPDFPSDGSAITGAVYANGNYSGGHYAQLGSGAAQATSSCGGAYSANLPQDTTSAYGGFIYNTEGAPIADADVPIGIGAAIANNTPAGLYQATYTLDAVGTF